MRSQIRSLFLSLTAGLVAAVGGGASFRPF